MIYIIAILGFEIVRMGKWFLFVRIKFIDREYSGELVV